MPATNMDGLRDYKFVVSGTLELEETDFWVDYTASRRDDGQVELGVILRDVWEHADLTKDKGLARRVDVEDRFAVIRDFIGEQGTLTLDINTPAVQRTFTGITLDGFSKKEASANELLEYDLEFLYPIDGFGGEAEIARTFKFGAYSTVSSFNLIVSKTRRDRTIFKPVFRAAPVRVPAGDNVEEIRLLAIRKTVAGATALIKRQTAEAELATWADRIGESGTLLVDGGSEGTCHLKEARPGNLELPDAVAYELLFYTGYST